MKPKLPPTHITILTLADDETWKSELVPWENWNQALKTVGQSKFQIIFAPLKDIAGENGALNSPVKTHTPLVSSILSALHLPAFLFRKVCVASNGYSGCQPILNPSTGKLEHYIHHCHFSVKQIFENLRPISRSLRHDAVLDKKSYIGNAAPVHTTDTRNFGWLWYEMAIFTLWTPSPKTPTEGNITMWCSGLHDDFQQTFITALEIATKEQRLTNRNPYTLLSIFLEELVCTYDRSVWAMRDHISKWESDRDEKAINVNYTHLNELVRHGTHISETLTTAIKSVTRIQENHLQFLSTVSPTPTVSPWTTIAATSKTQFCSSVLKSLLSRSEANMARLSNERDLAFHLASQRDSKVQMRMGLDSRQESIAMKAIAIITMTFLPTTFVSAVFSTTFFRYDKNEQGQEEYTISGNFWVFWAFSVPLTAVTIILWFFWDRYRMKRVNGVSIYELWDLEGGGEKGVGIWRRGRRRNEGVRQKVEFLC
ncbi:hypothetical protein B0T21DRAFT_423838 [Apiosordaria backusii]|uniref:Uncharacterized protein n=1 Tax=Apiosordaria backusii TaxID=314023 RepID=A0AA40ASU7_9PEZI|nr:hypothetical protein B0T21DRAFT_423838 [Apiosordaria backusii]